MDINVTILSGRLTRDPETRCTAAGATVLTFGLAVNDRVKDASSGEWTDRPNYLDCTVFGQRAERLAKRLSRGTAVTLTGRLRWSSWTQDGTKRSKVEVIVNEIDVHQGPRSSDTPVQEDVPPMYAEDIPF